MRGKVFSSAKKILPRSLRIVIDKDGVCGPKQSAEVIDEFNRFLIMVNRVLGTTGLDSRPECKRCSQPKHCGLGRNSHGRSEMGDALKER
ncbi:MAG: hypothetical protein CSA75_02640 [Sorangium cellulosum]|nr:MAG: hypothetical protein CSA75_02640 [Sorangium cellulosum]